MDKGSPELQPLADLRVIDLTHGVAGPFSTKLLADFGADVIKVEKPGTGDLARLAGPFPGDAIHPEKSGLFLHLNTNKRSLVLNLKTPEGVAIVKELVKSADILTESFRPGTMANLGLDYANLKQINPKLIMTSFTNFGQTGPYSDYKATELIFYAMGGRMNTTGLPDREPIKLGGRHVQYQAGNVGTMASLFAWYGQEYQSLTGQHVDISIFESQMASYNSRMVALLQYQYTGQRGRRSGNRLGGYPNGYYPCENGYVNVMGGGAFWPRTCTMLGRPDLIENPQFAPPRGQLDLESREEFEATIWLPWLMGRTKKQIVEECQAYKVPSGSLNTIDEVVDNNPQFDDRKYWVTIDHPTVGSLRYPGSPIMTQTQWWKIRRPAPLLGQHTNEILKTELSYSDEKLADLRYRGII